MRWLHLLLIVAFAFGFGPRLPAGGYVICGQPGAVSYDFERAAPVSPAPERCAHCLLAKALPPPEVPPLPGPRLVVGPAARIAVADTQEARPILAARPRAPPLSA